MVSGSHQSLTASHLIRFGTSQSDLEPKPTKPAVDIPTPTMIHFVHFSANLDLQIAPFQFLTSFHRVFFLMTRAQKPQHIPQGFIQEAGSRLLFPFLTPIEGSNTPKYMH